MFFYPSKMDFDFPPIDFNSPKLTEASAINTRVQNALIRASFRRGLRGDLLTDAVLVRAIQYSVSGYCVPDITKSFRGT